MSHASETQRLLKLARENGLPFASRTRPVGYDGNNTSGQKVYRVQGSNFVVQKHYSVLSWIGYGAYGVVCAAVDLRLDANSDYYDEAFISREQEGRCALEDTLKHTKYTPSRLSGKGTGAVVVPTLRYEPFQRRSLATTGTASPFVAIKKIPRVFDDLVDGRRILREVKTLNYLSGHPNIVKLLDLYSCGGESPDRWRDLYMVTELLDTDLYTFIKSGHSLDNDQLLFITYQMLKALYCVHSSGFIHRDIKPNNILLNSDCHVQLCDFGLARGGIPLFPPPAAARDRMRTSEDSKDEFSQYCFSSKPAAQSEPDDEPRMFGLTDYVVTRYYRAPELLIMGKYNHGVDVWAAGCILGEILLRRPLFAGSNYLSQLALIVETPGLHGMPTSATDVELMFEGGHEGKAYMISLLNRTFEEGGGGGGFGSPNLPRPARNELQGLTRAPPGIISLVLRMLTVDPRKRPSVAELMRDAVFRELYSSADEITVCSSACDDYFVPLSSLRQQAAKAPHEVFPLEAPPSWGVDHKVVDEGNLRRILDDEMKLFSLENKRSTTLNVVSTA